MQLDGAVNDIEESKNQTLLEALATGQALLAGCPVTLGPRDAMWVENSANNNHAKN